MSNSIPSEVFGEFAPPGEVQELLDRAQFGDATTSEIAAGLEFVMDASSWFTAAQADLEQSLGMNASLGETSVRLSRINVVGKLPDPQTLDEAFSEQAISWDGITHYVATYLPDIDQKTFAKGWNVLHRTWANNKRRELGLQMGEPLREQMTIGALISEARVQEINSFTAYDYTEQLHGTVTDVLAHMIETANEPDPI